MPPDEAFLSDYGGAEEGAHRWTAHLRALHRATGKAVLRAGLGGAGTFNAKGDEVKLFDLAADRAAVHHLEELHIPLILDSEEAGQRKLGPGEPEARVVLDPVDGSDNWARGLPSSALSCAVLSPDAPLRPDRAWAAIVGPFAEGLPWLAEAGEGAWRGETRITTSAVTRVVDALISVELNHFSPPPGVIRVMAEARGVRAHGCASCALAMVASGAADAHIDVRGRLTVESYLAGAFLVLEAGGRVVGVDGAPLRAAHGLTDRVRLVAAATPELCGEIVERLRGKRSG